MVKAPVYILWDETLQTDFATGIETRIKKLLNDFESSELKIEFALAVIKSDSQDLTVIRWLEELGENSWPVFPAGKSLVDLISFDITTSLSGSFAEVDDRLIQFPPFVLVVSHRRVSEDVDITAAITRLLDNPSRPRLAVLSSSPTNSWASGVDSALESRKEFLTHLKSEEVSSLDASFLKITNYLHAKHNEVTSSSSGNAPSTPLDSSARPVISIDDPVTNPTTKISNNQEKVPGSPPAQASGSKEVESPALTDVVVATQQVSNGRRRALKRGRSRKISLRAKRRQNRINRMMERGASNPASSLLPRDVSLPREDLISVDGQLIVDVPSTLNAKPWYTPDWKKLPLHGPSRDLELDYGSLKKLRVMAASARGTKHQFYGNENQDAFNIGSTKSGSHLIVVVADGVSSAQFSAYGSRALSFLVSQSVVSQIESFSEGDALDMKSIIETAVRQASDRTQNWQVDELYGPQSPPNENSLNDVAATLSVAVVGTTQDKLGSRSVTLACIGDSPCYTLRGAKWTLRSTATKDGVLLEQGTRALPVRLGEDPRLEWFEFDLSDSEVLVLMTDGIGTSLDNGNTAVGRWLAPRLYGPVPLEHFIGTLTYDRQGEDDDRTLAIIYDFEGIVSAIAETQKSVPEGEL